MKPPRLILGFLLAGILLALLWEGARQITESRTGTEHVFELNQVPPFLPDELALEKARLALAQDEPDIDWQPKEDRRTIDPDNKRDIYLTRNEINPNQGYIHFLSKTQMTTARFVSVKLDGNHIICQVTKPK